MNFLSLLGKQLKDDEVIEILEWGAMEVVYDFDRSHENHPDRYWAAARNHGIQFGFDAHQRLEVIFLHAVPAEGFNAVDRSDCDVPFFASLNDVDERGARNNVRVSKGEADLLGVHRQWAKLDNGDHALHYEFQNGALTLVTVSKTR